MQKTAVLGADPDIPRIVARDGKHVFPGHAGHGNEPAILKISSPALRRHPNPTAVVLAERLHTIIWQSSSGYFTPRSRRGDT
jgi:hypothetical protein